MLYYVHYISIYRCDVCNQITAHFSRVPISKGYGNKYFCRVPKARERAPREVD